MSIESSINIRYPAYVYYYYFFIIAKIECWPVFKQDPDNSNEIFTFNFIFQIAFGNVDCI